MPTSFKPMCDWVWALGSWRTWRSRSTIRTWSRSMRVTCLPHTRRGLVSAAAHCYGNTCTTSRNCWRRTSTGGWWTGRIARPRRKRWTRCSRTSSCRNGRVRSDHWSETAPMLGQVFLVAALAVGWQAPVAAHTAPDCPTRPAAGNIVGEPEDLRSVHGELHVDLEYRTSVDQSGQTHFCYVLADGSEAPTLRVQPGDLLVLRLKNAEAPLPHGAGSDQAQPSHGARHSHAAPSHGGAMVPQVQSAAATACTR